jgi:hypothetical protein
MWRLLPLLAALAFLEVIVPWPDVAALVLGNAHRAEPRVISMRSTALDDVRHDRPQLLVQVRDTAQ